MQNTSGTSAAPPLTPTEAPPSSAAGVTPSGSIGSGVLNGLERGGSPMDFVKRNLKPVTQPATDPQVVTRPDSMKPVDVTPVSEAKLSDPLASFVDPFSDNAISTPENGDKAKAEAALQNEPPVEEIPEENPAEKSKQESIAALRRKANETEQKFEELQRTHEEAQEEIRQYSSGEKFPEELSSLRDRVKELEHYEQLQAFRLSSEYIERFTEPLDQLKHSARELAQKYAVDEAKLDQALAIEKIPDRNAFLLKAFKGDSVAALEARELLDDMESLDREAFEAEKTPATEWARLQNDARVKHQKQSDQRVDRIKTVARSVWSETLKEFNGNQSFPELSMRPNDIEHNKVVKPLHELAAREYGALTVKLAEAGAADLPPDVMKVLSKWALLAQSYSVVTESRKQHYERSQQLEANGQRRGSMLRPQVGAHSVSSPTPASKPDSPKAAAQELMKQVGITQRR